MGKLQGRKALVTGGAMGIGLATARRLLDEGCDVTIWDLNAGALKKAEKELKALHKGNVFAYECDVTDKKKVKTLAGKAEKDMGCVDFLINNAGIEMHGRFCDKRVEDWERETAVNLNSIYYCTHSILPGMYKRNYGHIVNISSAAGLVGVGDLAVYCATKWAVLGFTESLRVEAIMDKKNVRFTSIHPHFIKEGLFEGGRLSFLGELIVPRIKTHDVVARTIVDKALKKGRNTVKIPVSLQIAQILRGLLPDSLFQILTVRLFGTGRGMRDWVGYGKK